MSKERIVLKRTESYAAQVLMIQHWDDANHCYQEGWSDRRVAESLPPEYQATYQHIQRLRVEKYGFNTDANPGKGSRYIKGVKKKDIRAAERAARGVKPPPVPKQLELSGAAAAELQAMAAQIGTIRAANNDLAQAVQTLRADAGRIIGSAQERTETVNKNLTAAIDLLRDAMAGLRARVTALEEAATMPAPVSQANGVHQAAVAQA